MVKLEGKVIKGVCDFSSRMKEYPHIFENAAGEKLFPGTINVHVDQEIPIHEDFRIIGADINEPEQDLLFERCKINGVDAYRIRPLHLETGDGGHGDHILEISSSQKIEGVDYGSIVEIVLFRDECN